MGCTNSTLQKQSVALPTSSPSMVSGAADPAGRLDASKPSSVEKVASPTSTATPGSVAVGAEKAQPAAVAAAAPAESLEAAATVKPPCTLRKQRTELIHEQDLELLVTSYSCHDATVLSSLGKHCKEITWNAQVGLHMPPMEIKVHVDAAVLCSPQVSITASPFGALPSVSTRLFPEGSSQKATLHEDFQCAWPFRGVVAGIGETGRYEVRLPSLVHEAGQSEWFLATLVQQRGDGQFKVKATVLDAKKNVQELEFPAVKASDIRTAGTCQPLVVPEQAWILHVPAADPLMAMLSAGGPGTSFIDYLARPSFVDGKREAVALKVAKKRDVVSADIGFNALSSLTSRKTFSVPSDNAQYQQRAWTIYVGPHVSHIIEIERKSRVGADSRVITLSVDGTVLAEAAADDMKIAEAAGNWMCNFRFVAERELNFQVHECNVDGNAADHTVIVTRMHKSAHTCTVVVPDESNFHSAQFFVDGTEFHEMQPYTEPHQEENLSMPVHAFEQEFGIHVPTAVNPSLPAVSNLFSFGEAAQVVKVMEQGVKGKGLLPGGHPSQEACGGLFSVFLGACTECSRDQHVEAA